MGLACDYRYVKITAGNVHVSQHFPKITDLYVHVSQHLQESVIISYIYSDMLHKSSAGISEKLCEKELHFWTDKPIFATFFPVAKRVFFVYFAQDIRPAN